MGHADCPKLEMQTSGVHRDMVRQILERLER
jgi:hypothetical protein